MIISRSNRIINRNVSVNKIHRKYINKLLYKPQSSKRTSSSKRYGKIKQIEEFLLMKISKMLPRSAVRTTTPSHDIWRQQKTNLPMKWMIWPIMVIIWLNIYQIVIKVMLKKITSAWFNSKRLTTILISKNQLQITSLESLMSAWKWLMTMIRSRCQQRKKRVRSRKWRKKMLKSYLMELMLQQSVMIFHRTLQWKNPSKNRMMELTLINNKTM